MMTGQPEEEQGKRLDESRSRFEAAARHAKHLPSKPSNENLLRLYALFKQVNQGDCSGDRPGAFNLTARAKWDAWKTLEGTERVAAETMYVDLVRTLDPTWSPLPVSNGQNRAAVEEDAVAVESHEKDEAELEQEVLQKKNSAKPTQGVKPGKSTNNVSLEKKRSISLSIRPATPSLITSNAVSNPPLTPTFVRSMKNDDHTAYLISVSYSKADAFLNTTSFQARQQSMKMNRSLSDLTPVKPLASEDPQNSGFVTSPGSHSHETTGIGETTGTDEIVWHITARYSDFVRLHSELLSKEGFREDDLPALPPKKWLFNQSPTFVGQRMADLQKYTQMLLLDPRVVRSMIVKKFFKVEEHLMMDQKHKMQMKDHHRISNAESRSKNTTAESRVDAEANASELARETFQTAHSTEEKKALPSELGTENIVPSQLVALDTEENEIRSADILSFERETFLILPWNRRNASIEVRFQGGLYVSFIATDKANRGERTMQLLRRGSDNEGETDDVSKSTPQYPGKISFRVRLRTNKVVGDMALNSSGGAKTTPNSGAKNGSESESSPLKQVLLLTAGFLIASLLSWCAFHYEAPLATTMSLPLLPIAIVMGVVFGDLPKEQPHATQTLNKKKDLILNIGVTLMSYTPASESEEQQLVLPRYIDMSGKWQVDSALSKTTVEPMTKALGIGWAMRKTINMISFTTVINHSPEEFERYDMLNGKRVGKEQPPFKLDGESRRVEDEKGYVHIRCWSKTGEAKVIVETTMPETPKSVAAVLTDTLTLENKGEWLHQRIKVDVKGSKEPVYVDRILRRVDGTGGAIEGPGAWASS